MAEFIPNEAGLNRLLRSRDGAVSRYITKVTLGVQAEAKRTAPVSKPLEPRLDRKPGNLRRNIIVDFVLVPGVGLRGRVVANVDYALSVHEGSKPHEIKPNKANILRFPVSPTVILFRPKVNHPGTQNPQPFLRKALSAIITGGPKGV